MGLLKWMRRGSKQTEALADSLAASGAAGTSYSGGTNEDAGWRRLGQGARDVPSWSLEKARTFSIHAYRVNPMARAIIDTYSSFVTGDSGLRPQCTDSRVRGTIDRFWRDPRNNLGSNATQELLLRTHMLMGESAYNMLVAPNGNTRFSPVDTTVVEGVELDHGNPLWPKTLVIREDVGTTAGYSIVNYDDVSGLSDGEMFFWPDWRALSWDTRGYPFLAPVIDWLDAYDRTIWNLIDRTAIARYLVFDVEIQGGQTEIDNWIKARGGSQPPPSGSMEIHNQNVKMTPTTANVGAFEDKQTVGMAMTNIAAGAGLSKTWLAEPEDANRATSLTMAEPVRRRVRGVQGLWLAHMTDMARFAVDRAVAAQKLPRQVSIEDATGNTIKVPSCQVVSIVGPEIAATDAQVNATILMSLSQALAQMPPDVMSRDAMQVAARKAWEDYVGVPYDPALDKKADPDQLADYIGNQDPKPDALSRRLTAV